MRVLVAPEGTRDFLCDAVRAGGGDPVRDPSVAEAVVWTSPHDAQGLRALLDAHPHLGWVQLPWSGIERFLPILDRDRLWTAAQGIYARDVAEHALALILAGLRDLKRRAVASSWEPPSGRSLRGARVTILGAGGIARELALLLAPFEVELTVVRRGDEAFSNARVLPLSRRIDALRDADVVALALALTPETAGCIGADELRAMKPTAWLVNVARGGHVDTEALLNALQRNEIGGAALDVTDPEPLPPGHLLFSLPNAIVTPHCANTPEMALPVLTERVRENVRRRVAGEALLGVIDHEGGY